MQKGGNIVASSNLLLSLYSNLETKGLVRVAVRL